MRNPQSFQLIRATESADHWFCYTYRAQNGFGGMDEGLSAYDGKTYPLFGGDQAWIAHCGGRPVTDDTTFARYHLENIPID